MTIQPETPQVVLNNERTRNNQLDVLEQISTASTAANAAVGAPSDAVATTDTGTFSLISLTKRVLGKMPTLVSGRIPVDGSGVTQPVSGVTSVGSAPTMAPVSVSGVDAGGLKRHLKTNTSGELQVQAGGQSIVTSNTVVRPADTTAYAVGDLIANSTTAGSVTPIAMTVSRLPDVGGMVRRVRLRVDDASWKNATVRVHFYRDSPTLGVGDNGVFNSSETLQSSESHYIGSADVLLDKQFAQGTVQVKGISVPNTGSEIVFDPSSGTQLIYALLEARTAVTPAASKTFSLSLEVLQN